MHFTPGGLCATITLPLSTSVGRGTEMLRLKTKWFELEISHSFVSGLVISLIVSTGAAIAY